MPQIKPREVNRLSLDLAAKARQTLSLFRTPQGKIHVGVLAVFVFINGLGLVNAVLHDPRVGYDAAQHLSYILTLAKGHTPNFEESRSQSFSPPLSYALPALLLRVAAQVRGETAILDKNLVSQDSEAGLAPDERRSQLLLLGVAAKFAQVLNWLFAIGLTIYILKICELVRPGRADFKFCALLSLAVLPVYYKSFSFVRGEPLGAFLVVVAAYYFLTMLLKREFGLRRALTLGVVLGLAILSRQWSFLVVPAFACSFLLTWRSRKWAENKAFASALAGAILVAALAGGWFYLSYPWSAATPGRFGPYMARVSDPISEYKDGAGNSYWTHVTPLSFGINIRNLFKTPVRDALADQVIPIFYSDTWGDYWGYFLTSKSDQSESFSRYLGRVNVVAVLPSILFLAGIFLGAYRLVVGGGVADYQTFGVMLMLIAWSLAGFAYFLLVMPNTGNGVGVKAAYMLQVFRFVSILAAAVLEVVGRKYRRLYLSVVILLACIAIHNLPAMITHYFISYSRPQLAW
jgi:Dolichyl-phosphate-mannose-protein mannosyltransferase